MKLKSNSWYGWYYTQFYQCRELPISLCKFFWGILLAIVLFPVTWPSTSINKITKDESSFSGAAGIVLWLISLSFGTILKAVFHIKSRSLTFLVIPIVGFIILTTIIFATFFLIVFIENIKEKHPSSRKIKEKKPNWFAEGIKAFFGKYCPRIEWIKE